MRITAEQFALIQPHLPVQRGNVEIDNLRVINAILYVCEHSCKWRGLPQSFGNWHTIYTRFNRWAKNGVLERIFAALQEEQIISIDLETISLDSVLPHLKPENPFAGKFLTEDVRHDPKTPPF